jgi:hypothetical protein
VHVVDRAAAGSSASADQGALSSADQSARARANRGADTDALRGFAFAGFRITTMATMPVSICRWSECSDQHDYREHQGDESRKESSQLLHSFILPRIVAPQILCYNECAMSDKL